MVFLCIIYCLTDAVAVMYSRNIPMAKKRIVCLQSKNSENIYKVLLISNNNYIYSKRYFEIFVTNDFLVYSGGQLLSDWKTILFCSIYTSVLA